MGTVTLPAALPGRRERQIDSTRARLFQAAIAEFRRVGFARANVATITRKAGVSRPSFYFHFPTKEHVLLELEWLEERRLVERIEPARSLREALYELADGLIDIEVRLGDPDLFRDMFTIYARQHSDFHVEEQRHPIVPVLARHFGEAAARGELRPGLDPEAAARVCVLSVFGHLTGPSRAPEQRRGDLILLFSLYLAEDAT
jgi:AcrR family transcriptional regulator